MKYKIVINHVLEVNDGQDEQKFFKTTGIVVGFACHGLYFRCVR